MEKLDELVLGSVIERILAPGQLRKLLTELRKRMQSVKQSSKQTIQALEKQLKGIEERLGRLYEAIEVGSIDINDEPLNLERAVGRGGVCGCGDAGQGAAMPNS